MMSTVRLILVLCLVCAVNSKYVDYCSIEKRSCASHVFTITGYDSWDTFKCNIQPWQYDEHAYKFVPVGEPVKIPTTKLNETSVECKLPALQSGQVTLESEHYGPGESADIYPKLCFKQCDSPLIPFCFRTAHGPGCYIDSMCYPHLVLDPENPLHVCDSNKNAWSNVTELSLDLVPGGYNGYKAVDMCAMHISSLSSAKGWNAKVPDEAGGWGLNLTADGAHFTMKNQMYHQLFHFYKFYVKFSTEPITEPTTFFEIPSALKLQYKPDETIIVEYTFIDSDVNRVKRFVTLRKVRESSWVKLNARIYEANAHKKKRQANPISKGWNMIALAYDARDGAASIKVYFNGVEADSDIGDTAGLYLRPSKNEIILSNGVFSCIESPSEADENFPSRDFKECAANVREESDYKTCETKYYNE